MKVRTRFAPSPTGYLHAGSVRTALFAWLVARQAGGKFLLRIEDTDRQRHIKAAEQHIIDSLKWLGIEFDEELYRQSERLDVYKEWAAKLAAAGRAYADTSTPEELDKLRSKAKAAKKPFLFRDYRPGQTPEWKEGMPLRFKSEPKDYGWHDKVMGDLSSGPEAVDDFILIKSDGYPTYNFAHIIDDHLMNITDVIRSQEFLPSVPKFLNLYEALGIEPPAFATLPYVLGPDGKKKLSKRDGAKDLLDYKREGYLPEALVSFLATLGWNDGSEQEIYTVEELVKKFDLSRVQHGGAKFDEQRLLWVSGHFIRKMPLDKLYGLSEPFWPPTAADAGAVYKKAVLGLVQERLKFLAELPELTGFFFEEPKLKTLKELYSDPKTQKLISLPPAGQVKMAKAAIEKLKDSDFSTGDLLARLNLLLDELDTNPRALFTIIRIAITGVPYSPEISGTLNVLGKQKSLARLKNSISALEK